MFSCSFWIYYSLFIVTSLVHTSILLLCHIYIRVCNFVYTRVFMEVSYDKSTGSKRQFQVLSVLLFVYIWIHVFLCIIVISHGSFFYLLLRSTSSYIGNNGSKRKLDNQGIFFLSFMYFFL